MTLADLTSPLAVTRALDEFDQLGRNAFLSRYGFGPARSYFVMRDGRMYDSKAIAGAAHGFQHGDPLRSSDFSGGDATVAARLSDLGFEVSRNDPDWKFTVGDVTTRADIHGTYGGAAYGGIEPSKTTPNLIIYTDPEQGRLNGYNYDGWDRNDPNVFYYTGMGLYGDQVMDRRNKSLRDHAAAGQSVRLFEVVDEPRREGGKRQRYLGAFYVDPAAPYRTAPAKDKAGEARTVLVFRLVREGTTPLDVEAAPPDEQPEAAVADEVMQEAAGDEVVSQEDDVPREVDITGDADVEVVSSERNVVDEFELQPRTGSVARREEAKLVSQFEAHLRGRGRELGRLRIRIPGERHELVTDTYDLTRKTLYEAKSKSDRATVRLAIGQLMDYLRFAPDATGALLVPEEPTADVKRLVRSCGFTLVFRRLGSWVTEAAD